MFKYLSILFLLHQSPKILQILDKNMTKKADFFNLEDNKLSSWDCPRFSTKNFHIPGKSSVKATPGQLVTLSQTIFWTIKNLAEMIIFYILHRKWQFFFSLFWFYLSTILFKMCMHSKLWNKLVCLSGAIWQDIFRN